MRHMLTSLLGTTIILGNGLALAAEADLQALEQAARKEDQVNSVGMPGSWASQEDTWKDLENKYGLRHMDTDMSSAQELAKFKTGKDNASADIGDVGAASGPITVQQGVSQPYKPSTWEQTPTWAKDQDGHWALAYTGTIAFIVNKQLMKDVPHSWADLLQSKYKVTIDDVSAAAQAVNGMLAAAIANGGGEKNIKPGLEFFGRIAKQSRLSLTNPVIATLEKGEVEAGIVWNFNGLSYRQRIDPERFEAPIPSDGSMISGCTTIISKYAKHPNTAELAREYIFSDAGQINLAKGNTRPVRAESLILPDDVKAQLLSNEQYAKAQPIKDAKVWEETSKRLPRQQQEAVIINMQ